MRAAQEWQADWLAGYGLKGKTPAEAAGAARLLGLKPPARVLDVACGAGRHSLALATLGYRVTGLDYSRELLDRGRISAGVSGIPVRFVRGDMRRLRFRAAFDGAVNLFTSFGYFETDAEDLAVLRGVRRALRPGGRFLIDVLNRDWLLRNFSSRFRTRVREGEVAAAENRLAFDAFTSRLHNRRTLIYRDGRRTSRDLDFKVYTLHDLTRLVQAAGLRFLEAYGGLDGRPYGLDAFRLVVLAEGG